MSINCPACHDSKVQKKIIVRILIPNFPPANVYKCILCKHKWLEQNAEFKQSLELLYGEQYSGFKEDPYFKKKIKIELNQRIKSFYQKGDEILDVGCGNGEFVKEATEAGYSCLGIDYYESAVQIAKQRGLNVEHLDFLEKKFNTKFSIITMWDVAEHLENPGKFLEKCKSILSDSGVLILKIPSYGTFNFILLKIFPTVASVLLDAPAHIQYFSRKSLVSLLRRTGFNTVIWGPQVKFRSNPPAKSLKQMLTRFVKKIIGIFSRNKNLYVFALVGKDIKKLSPEQRTKFNSIQVLI